MEMMKIDEKFFNLSRVEKSVDLTKKKYKFYLQYYLSLLFRTQS